MPEKFNSPPIISRIKLIQMQVMKCRFYSENQQNNKLEPALSEMYKYYNESSLTEFIHYKVYGGGHDWFGSSWVADWGFNASQELIDFFLQYRLSDFIDTYLLGDLNEDGLINIQDVILIINLILNQEYQSVADINNDNLINILDVVQLVDIILN